MSEIPPSYRDFSPIGFRPHADLLPGASVVREYVDTPEEVRRVVEQGRSEHTNQPAYRVAHRPSLLPSRWMPVIVRGSTDMLASMAWPAMRTAVPAGLSALLAVVGLTLSVTGVALAGVFLGSAVSALVARTQYSLEQNHLSLSSLWLSADGSHLLLGRFETLSDRVRRRLRWRVFPIEILGDLAIEAGFPFAYIPSLHHARAVQALERLGVPHPSLDVMEGVRIYTLIRLARWRAWHKTQSTQ